MGHDSLFVERGILPVFAAEHDLRASKFMHYFRLLYGEPEDLRQFAFPLDLATFHVFRCDLLRQAGLHMPVSRVKKGGDLYKACHQLKPGDLYEGPSRSAPPRTVWVFKMASQVYEYADNTWVEVTHCADLRAPPRETDGMWCYAATGSGAFVNTGRSIIFEHHVDMVWHFLKRRCRGQCPRYKYPALLEAANQGYDSVQFTRHFDMHCGQGLPTHCEIVILPTPGTKGCPRGRDRERFAAGWLHSRPCRCDAGARCLNCEVGGPPGRASPGRASPGRASAASAALLFLVVLGCLALCPALN
jgi:hypothetical protein